MESSTISNDISFTQIKLFYIQTSYGKIFVRSVGVKKNPLFLIIHGSGPNNSGESYQDFLFEYSIRFSNTFPLYMVAFDCPGYGKSTGLKSVIRGFSEKFLSELIFNLTGKKNAFILMGHSQGGNSLYNAVFENNNITNFIIAERPVIADPKKFKDSKIPTLFVYDEEDDGHPIKQGKEMTKLVKYYKFISYKGSLFPYWNSDKLIEELISFLYEFKNFFWNKEDVPDFKKIEEVNDIKINWENICNINNSENINKNANANFDSNSNRLNKFVNNNFNNNIDITSSNEKVKNKNIRDGKNDSKDYANINFKYKDKSNSPVKNIIKNNENIGIISKDEKSKNKNNETDEVNKKRGLANITNFPKNYNSEIIKKEVNNRLIIHKNQILF